MWKEIDDLYCYLEKLEEAYHADSLNYQDYLAQNEARAKVDVSISNIENLLTKLYLRKEAQKSTGCVAIKCY